MKQVKYQKRYSERDEFDQFTLHLEDDGGRVVKKRDEKKPSKVNIWQYVGFAGDLGFTIAVPIAGGALLGGAIDKRMATYPNMTLSFLLFGIMISMFGFVRIIRDLIQPKK